MKFKCPICKGNLAVVDNRKTEKRVVLNEDGNVIEDANAEPYTPEVYGVTFLKQEHDVKVVCLSHSEEHAIGIDERELFQVRQNAYEAFKQQEWSVE